MELEIGRGDNETYAERGPTIPPLPGGALFAPSGGVLHSLRGIPKFLTLRIRGTV